MYQPGFADYVSLIGNLFDHFMQAQNTPKRRGYPDVYTHKVLIVFFVLMQFLRIFAFKAQHRWLQAHAFYAQDLGFPAVQHRTTLSRRYKRLYPLITRFVQFIGQYAGDLDEALADADWYVDKSLFGAQGTVWHQSDRKTGRIPEKLRNLATDATWAKSACQGRVYGYGLHTMCTRAAFPKLLQVETATFSESRMLKAQEEVVLQTLRPHTLTGDNSYTKAYRIRKWAKRGVVLLTPATKWVKGRFTTAYHRFIQQPFNQYLLATRRTSVEPLFDLIARLLGVTSPHKRLPVQHIESVQTCLALATLTLQIAIIANVMWGLPLRNISTISTAFT